MLRRLEGEKLRRLEGMKIKVWIKVYSRKTSAPNHQNYPNERDLEKINV